MNRAFLVFIFLGSFLTYEYVGFVYENPRLKL